jgi:hypothetical protein
MTDEKKKDDKDGKEAKKMDDEQSKDVSGDHGPTGLVTGLSEVSQPVRTKSWGLCGGPGEGEGRRG